MIVTAMLVRWAEGWHEVTNPTAIAATGRREGTLGLGAVSSLAEVTTVTTEQLRIFSDPRTEIACDVDPPTDADAPFVAYRTADSIVVPDLPGRPASSQRVQAITATMDDNGRVTYAVELADVLLDERERFAETLTKMANGTLDGWSRVAQPASYSSAEQPPAYPYPPNDGGGGAFTLETVASYDAYDTSDILRSVPPGDGTYTLTSMWSVPDSDGPVDGAPPYVELWQLVPGGDGNYSVAVVNLGLGYTGGVEYVATITDNSIVFDPERGIQFHIYGTRTSGVHTFAEFEGGGEQVIVGWPGPTLRVSTRRLT